MTETTDLMRALAEPIPASEVKHLRNAGKKSGIAYITARTVMNRLDRVIGPENWQDKIEVLPGGNALCTLSLRINGEWISKTDIGNESDIEPEKGAASIAFKRAGVKWGIGRELYQDGTAYEDEGDQRKPSAGMKTEEPRPANGKPAWDENAVLTALGKQFPAYTRDELKVKLAKVSAIKPTMNTDEVIAAFLAAVEAARLAAEVGGELAPKA